MNQSTPCYDDITDYHSEETDDWYVNEGNLKDPRKNRITVDQTVQGTVEISQLQHNDNVVNISVEEIVRVSQVQVMTKTNRDPTVTARVSLMLNSDRTVETFASIQHRHSFGHSWLTDFLRVSEGEHLQTHEYVSKTIWIKWTVTMMNQGHCASRCM